MSALVCLTRRKNSVCDPELGNDFRDVSIFQPISSCFCCFSVFVFSCVWNCFALRYKRCFFRLALFRGGVSHGTCHRASPSRDLFYCVVNIPFYCFEYGGLGFITQLKYLSLLKVIFAIVSFITCESSWTSNKHENVYSPDRSRHKARFTSTRETRNECCKSPRARLMRQ